MFDKSRKVLIGSVELQDELRSKKFQVDYYRLKETSESGEEEFYGVEIGKSLLGANDALISDDNYQAYVTDSREEIDRLIKSLINNTVTPVTAPESIDAIVEIPVM